MRRSSAIAAVVVATAGLSLTAGACGDEGEPGSPSASSSTSSGGGSTSTSSSGGGSTSSGSASSGSSGSAADAASDAPDGAAGVPSAALETLVVDGTVKPVTMHLCQQAGQDYEINGIHQTNTLFNARALFRRNGPPTPGTYVATSSVGDSNASVQHFDASKSFITPALGNPGAGTGTVTVVDRAGKLGIFWNDVSVSGATGTRTVSANFTCP